MLFYVCCKLNSFRFSRLFFIQTKSPGLAPLFIYFFDLRRFFKCKRALAVHHEKCDSRDKTALAADGQQAEFRNYTAYTHKHTLHWQHAKAKAPKEKLHDA